MGTLIRNTTHIKRRTGGGWVDIGVNGLKRRTGGGWVNVNVALRRTAGGWVYIYSTPDLNVSGGGAATGSGASSSGSAAKQAFATPGGSYVSASYSWTRLTPDNGITPDDANSQNPTFSRSFSGVANGTTSSGVSENWRCTMTDTVTGAQAYADVTIGPLAWQNTIPAFTSQRDPFVGPQSGTCNRPAGANNVTIYIIGGGGNGGSGAFVDGDHQYGGGGGGGGGRVIWSGPAANAYSFTAGGAAQASSVSGIGTANQGSNGQSSDGFSVFDGAGGDGGTASGGNVVNNTGGQGGNAGSGSGGFPGSGQQDDQGTSYGQGGEGGSSVTGGQSGQQGAVVFVWSL